jgi:hypothetical protein
MRLAAARGWNVMRNFGSDAEHRDALDDYIKVAEHGHARWARTCCDRRRVPRRCRRGVGFRGPPVSFRVPSRL